jgi:hypothetical protein
MENSARILVYEANNLRFHPGVSPTLTKKEKEKKQRDKQKKNQKGQSHARQHFSLSMEIHLFKK